MLSFAQPIEVDLLETDETPHSVTPGEVLPSKILIALRDEFYIGSELKQAFDAARATIRGAQPVHRQVLASILSDFAATDAVNILRRNEQLRSEFTAHLKTTFTSMHQQTAIDELQRLRSVLELTPAQLASMIGLDTHDVVALLDGDPREIPARTSVRIHEMARGLTRLLRIFRPERLPDVIRRSARAFADESALEMILRGRINDVAAIYERTLTYQG